MTFNRLLCLVAAVLLSGCELLAEPPTVVGEEAVSSEGTPMLIHALHDSPAATRATPPPAEVAASPSEDGSPIQPSAQPDPPTAQATRRCPLEMARIGRYCIDRWEAHLVEPGSDPPSTHPHNIPPLDDRTYEARSAAGVLPQAHISRGQARRACEASDKRLCAWIEWRRACQGSKWQRWPYGNAREPGRCNSEKDHLLSRLFGDDPKAWRKDDFNDPRLSIIPGFLAPTGSHEGCVSPDGLFDMVGNLNEWVIDTVSRDFIHKMKQDGMARRPQPRALGNGIFMGGFYSTRSEHGQGCFFTTIAHSPRYFDYSTGFRCCRDADPPAAPPTG